MLKICRLLRDYLAAGSLNELLAPWGFVDDSTFLTKGGHLGLVYRLHGVDYEGLDHAQRDDIAHRFTSTLRLLDESCRVYVYAIKRRIEPLTAEACRDPFAHEAIQRRLAYLNERRDTLYDIDLFLVLLLASAKPRRATSVSLRGLRHLRQALQEWLSVTRVVTLLEEEFDRAHARLEHQAVAVEIQLSDLGPTRLAKADAFQFFRSLINYQGHKAAAPLISDTHLDYFMADSPVECHRRHLDVDGVSVKTLTMKEPPSATFPHMLEDLYRLPCEMVACLEWQRLPADRVRRDLRARQRHFYQKRVSLVNYVSLETKAEDVLVDESAGATMRQIGDAMTDVEVNRHFFGECSLTLVLHDADIGVVDRAVATAVRAFGSHDGVLFEETYNGLNAWVSIVPGNTSHNLRQLALLETHAADLAFLFTLDRGNPICPHLGREALAIFETQHDTPYHFNFHVNDVGHTLVLGATGAGKSFLLNFLLTHAQRYDPLTFIFDFGHSYRKLTTLLQGTYVEVGLGDRGFSINPFAFPPTAEHVHFLHGFVRLLLEGGDGYHLTEAEDRELYDALQNIYVLEPTQRRLLTLAHLLPRSLDRRLHKWVQGGRYASMFDNVEDTLTLQRMQVFDFQAIRAFPEVLDPLLFYVLRRVMDRVQDPALAGMLKVCAIDEAWWVVRQPVLRDFTREQLKTSRRHNGVMLLATQTSDDFAGADLLRTVVESCPTRLLLANPAFDQDRYAELFQLTTSERQLLSELMPRGQILLKRPDHTKVLNLRTDKKSYWLYTNTPLDNERANAVLREYGFAEGLDRLAAAAA